MKDKVIERARELGLDVEVRRLDGSTATVQQAADAVGCAPGCIAKSIVFIADGDPVLCVASGAHRIDTDRLADILDVAELRQATPDEVRAATGFAVGGVPPLGHDLPAVFDSTLLEHETVFAAGGDGHSLFEVDPHRLVACTGAEVADIG